MSYRSGARRVFLVAAALAPLCLALSCGGKSRSDPVPLGTVESIVVLPAAVMLRGPLSTVQLEVTGITDTGRTVDLTAPAEGTTYASSDPGVADVTMDGLVSRQGVGTATLTVTNGAFSVVAPVYSDTAPPLTEGDFDFLLGSAPAKQGETLTIPLMLEVGAKTFGSYRAIVTFDSAQFEFVRTTQGPDLGSALAVRSDVAGEVEILDTYTPSLGQSLTGRIDLVRIVLRATGSAGDSSMITGTAVEVFDDAFPALPIGPSTPRAFVTGNRWLAIQ